MNLQHSQLISLKCILPDKVFIVWITTTYCSKVSIALTLGYCRIQWFACMCVQTWAHTRKFLCFELWTEVNNCFLNYGYRAKCQLTKSKTSVKDHWCQFSGCSIYITGVWALQTGTGSPNEAVYPYICTSVLYTNSSGCLFIECTLIRWWAEKQCNLRCADTINKDIHVPNVDITILLLLRECMGRVLCGVKEATMYT